MRYRKETKSEELFRRGNWRKVFVIFPKECYKDYVGDLFYGSIPSQLTPGNYEISVYLGYVEMREYYEPRYDGSPWHPQYRTLEESAEAKRKEEAAAQEVQRHRNTFGA